MFAGYIVAIILAVIVLFPSIIATTKTARSSLGMVLLISNISLSNVAEGLCVFAVDSVMVLLAVCHLVRENKKDKFNKFSAFALIILSVPLVFNGCLNLLNMGTFFGFIARFYLLNQVWLFIFLQKFLSDFFGSIFSANFTKM